MTSQRTSRSAPIGSGVEDVGALLSDQLVDRVERVLGELIDRKLSPIAGKIENLQELLTRRRKDHFVVEEMAELIGRSAYTVRRWISEGKVRAIRISDGGPRGRLLIPRAELERLIAAGKGATIPDGALD